ncbi:aldo/keto reductase [Jatrophihabitans fulvus]
MQRIGFGSLTLSLTRNAEGARDPEAAVRLVRHAVERGIDFIDTANIYGLGRSERLIADALRPYASDVTVATKAGYEVRRLEPGETRLPARARPADLAAECDRSLERLGVDCIDVYLLHTPDPAVPFLDSVGALVELQHAGKIRHIGLSNVMAGQLDDARGIATIVCVQNRYNAGDREFESVLHRCEQLGIAFLPWHPIVRDEAHAARLAEVARRHRASVQQIALAWLLRRSPIMLPIPGTTSVEHLDANIDTAWIELGDADFALLSGGAPAAALRGDGAVR